MSVHQPHQPHQPQPYAPPQPGPSTSLPRTPGAPSPRRGVGRFVAPLVAGLVGMLLGLTIGVSAGGGEDTGRVESLEAELAEARADREAADDEAQEGIAANRQTAADLAEREAEVAAAEAALAEREAAVSAVEERVAATSVEEGTWTVGVDVAPGTYRTAAPVGEDCYWSLTVTGSNGRDITANDIPGGGIPTVVAEVGQDFTHRACGTFVLQP